MTRYDVGKQFATKYIKNCKANADSVCTTRRTLTNVVGRLTYLYVLRIDSRVDASFLLVLRCAEIAFRTVRKSADVGRAVPVSDVGVC